MTQFKTDPSKFDELLDRTMKRSVKISCIAISSAAVLAFVVLIGVVIACFAGAVSWTSWSLWGPILVCAGAAAIATWQYEVVFRQRMWVFGSQSPDQRLLSDSPDKADSFVVIGR